MSLLDELKLDQVEDAAREEEKLRLGPIPPEGLHHAVLSGVRADQANSGTKFRELTFTVVGGAAAGMTVKETLWSPAGRSAEADARGESRMRIFAHRLGLIRKVPGPDGKATRYAAVEGRYELSDCIGAECVIVVKHEQRKFTGKDGQERKITEAVLDFEGVLSLDDPKAKGVPRGKAGSPAAAVTQAAQAQARQQQSFDDL